MKKILIMLLSAFTLLVTYTALFVEPGGDILDSEFFNRIEAHTDKMVFGEPVASNYLPDRPEDVPIVNCDGDTIIWDWKYQVAYNEKRLFFHYNEENCVVLVVLKK